jgi:prepilin-type N-terminal cleavage/methylation domain-containing protein
MNCKNKFYSFQKVLFYRNKNRKAFTLIELLVVIAIIGLLATIVMIALNSARAKARDAKRIADLRELVTALEGYASDNGQYPVGAGCVNNDCMDASSPAGSLEVLVPTYISKLSEDPNMDDGRDDDGYGYMSSTGSGYSLVDMQSGNVGAENMKDFSSDEIVSSLCGAVVNGQCSTGNNAVGFGVGIDAGKNPFPW